ncbi:MAG TPA: 3-hydroxyisobutyryl-CoA hydrolase [Actinobacteria bacterium]|jgi:enoyl-CoA hydratase|nr:3-hydroxyisobutyryl-CoA hydrolase [Actinomycetota bacterium]
MTDILFDVDGGIGYITLNRPKARNALTTSMVVAISEHLDQWGARDDIRAVLIRGAGDHGLCAGGDVRAMYAGAIAQDDSTVEFFRAEYRMNAKIHQFSKPYIAIMDGIVMGGGIGVSAHGSVRIVTERSVLAMPEVTIGICPDVGATWLLAQAPGELGTYLAMTGASFGPGDAIYLGFADLCMPTADLATFEMRVQHEALDDLLRELTVPAPDSPLEQEQAWIDDCFRYGTVQEILDALDRSTQPQARATGALIRTKSPSAVSVSLAAIRRARKLESVEHCLEMEFGISSALMLDSDGIEGVRALIIDKDRNPRWSPATFAEVTDEQVAAAFAPSRYGTLGLI